MLHYVVISIQTKTNRQVLKFWDWLIEAKLQVCLLVQTGQQHVFEWLYCTSLTKGLVDNVGWVVEFLERIYKFKEFVLKSKGFKKALVESCQDQVVLRNLNFCTHSARLLRKQCFALDQFILKWKQKVCWQCPAIFCLYTFCSVQAKIQMLTTSCLLKSLGL